MASGKASTKKQIASSIMRIGLMRGGRLPNLIIIGAMKCSTTSLHYYLRLHPEVHMSRPKELDFFTEKYNWHRGLDWYRSHFPVHGATIYGEASPNYANYPRAPEVPGRMHDLVPEARLIYLVRDPIERMISHYVHKYSDGLEDRPVEEALPDENRKSYLHRSLYFLQLERFLAHYPPSQLLVISAEDLRDRRDATLRSVFGFLGVDPDFSSPKYARRRHLSAHKRRKTRLGQRLAASPPARLLGHLPNYLRWPVEDVLYRPFSKPIERPRLQAALRQDLADRLRADVNALRAFTGHDFAGWSV